MTTAIAVHQPTEALKLANEIRLYRHNVKRALRAREATFWQVIRAQDPKLDGMRVGELLAAAPFWGPTKVDEALKRIQVGPNKTIGTMTANQWRRLAECGIAACDQL